MFTDIKTPHLIAKLPEKIRPYAYLMRADRPIGSWLLFWPGVWAIFLAADFPAQSLGVLTTLILFAGRAPIMSGAVCTINDLWDRKLDREVERTAGRPLASGDISPRAAMIFLGALLAIGLIILLQLPWLAVGLGVLVLPLIAVYPYMKRLTFWPQAFLGLTFNFGALIGWAAMDNTLSAPALFLYGAGIFWTLFYDTVYAFQDIEDDLKLGLKSTAILFRKRPKQAVTVFYLISAGLLCTSFVMTESSLWALIPLVPAIWYGFRMIYCWNPGSQHNSLQTFKANKYFGMLVALGALVLYLI